MIKKLLVGYIIDGKHSGIDKYLLNFAAIAKNAGVHIDFLSSSNDPSLQKYLSEEGFGLYFISDLKNPKKQYSEIVEILKKGNYDGVYMNISESFNCMGILAAAKCKVPCRIVHSHSAGVDRDSKVSRFARTFLHKAFRRVLYKNATCRYACSDLAGKWMFKGDFETVFNAVDVEKFSYSEKDRVKTRKEFSVDDDTCVLLHIGSFSYTKNQSFLIDVLKELSAKGKKARLLCVGTGKDFESTVAYAKEKGVYGSIDFPGVRQDIPALLSSADIFLLPSRFEGLPTVLLEAQINGLYCIASDSITSQAKISEGFEFLSLESPKEWAEHICRADTGSRYRPDSGKLEDFSFESAKRRYLHILGGEQYE